MMDSWHEGPIKWKAFPCHDIIIYECQVSITWIIPTPFRGQNKPCCSPQHILLLTHITSWGFMMITSMELIQIPVNMLNWTKSEQYWQLNEWESSVPWIVSGNSFTYHCYWCLGWIWKWPAAVNYISISYLHISEKNMMHAKGNQKFSHKITLYSLISGLVKLHGITE